MLEGSAKQLTARRPDQQASIINTGQALGSVACDIVLSSDLLCSEETGIKTVPETIMSVCPCTCAGRWPVRKKTHPKRS